MPSTYSSNLKIELIGTGDQPGTWGDTTNNNFQYALEQAIVGKVALETADFTSNVCTLTLTDTNALQDARALALDITATLSAAGTVNVPAIQKPYIVFNNSVGGYAVTVKVSGQTGVSVPNGAKILVYNNGTDVGAAITHLTALTLATALPVASGGTGATASTGSGNVVLATSPTLTTPTLTNPTINDGYTEEVYTANSGTAITLNLSNGSVQIITLTGNATITMPTAAAGKSFILFLRQDATGSRTVTWSTVKWPSEVAPTLTTTASRQDVFSFFSDGTNWYGVTVSRNYTV